MAKLMVHLSVAVWLTVSLAVLIRARSWRDALNLTPIEELESKESKDPGSLSDRELKRLANSYIKGLPKGANIEAWDEGEVMKLIERSADLEIRYHGLDWEKLGMSRSWGSLLWLRTSTSKCNNKENIITLISENHVLGDYEHLQKFAFVFFGNYLKTCGYEKHFRQIVENIEQNSGELWNFEKYPDLNSHLVIDFWPRAKSVAIKEGITSIENHLSEMLSAIKQLSELGGISEQDCTNLWRGKEILRYLAYMIEGSKVRDIIGHYLALYLDTCRYEKRFKEVILSTEQISDKALFLDAYPTLYAYLSKEFLPVLHNKIANDYENEIEYVLTDLELGIFKDSECTDELESNFAKWLARTWDYQKLQEFIRYYFALYLNKCGFEERFADVKMQHKIFKNYDNLARYVDVAFFAEFGSSGREFDAMDFISTLDAVNKLVDLGQIDVSNCNKKTTDYIVELKSELSYMYHLKQEIYGSVVIADYMQGCADHFKERAKRFQEDKKGEWKFIEEYISNVMKYMSKGLGFAIPHVALESRQETEKFKGELKANCQVLIEYMHEAMDNVQNSVELVRKDKEYVEFVDYLRCCLRVRDST